VNCNDKYDDDDDDDGADDYSNKAIFSTGLITAYTSFLTVCCMYM